jgi:Tho complex subunit 7
MATFQLLDQQEEDKLHRTRLLAVEEKQFKRITKRLVSPSSLISLPTQLPPTPPPDSVGGDEATMTLEELQQKRLNDWRQFREDVLLDFAAFDSSIVRIQFLYDSNEAERERYRAEKEQIIRKAQEVRENTAQLRVQLEGARQTMEQRKRFDELAEKITNNRLLRPREDQEVNLQKLEEECRELEKESEAYSETWKERREQFGRIVEEGMQLRRLIRDEKEEVERREGMDGGEEDGEVNDTGSRGATPKHSSQSGGATPRPENMLTPKPDGSATPRLRSPSSGPSARHDSPDRRHEGLKPRPLPAGSIAGSMMGSQAGSRAGSRASSPAQFHRGNEEPEEGEDITMADAAKMDADAPMAGGIDIRTEAASEPLEDGQVTTEDHMDTT